MSRAGIAGSPLKLIGASPTPKAVSMLNCPGAKPVSAAPSSMISRVQVCGPSRRRRTTRATRGTIGSIALSPMVAVDVEDLQPRRLQAPDQDRHQALHHLVAEIVVGFAFPAQTGGVHRDRPDAGQRPRIIAPAIGRDQPGDADDFALAQGLESNRPAPRIGHRQGHAAMPDQMEGIRRFALADQVLARLEARISGAAADEGTEIPAQAGEERMLADDAFKAFHGLSPQGGALSRMAATSSVMSMPTGHQVMQRPQPTHPDVPNCSIHVASLWVIHWR